MPKILITGAGGQLGQEIQGISKNFPNFQYFWATHQDLDITNLESISTYIEKNGIEAIVNCAAYTAVDKAEQEVEKAYLINELGVKNLATVAKEKELKLIHISTDYVFDGQSNVPYNPEHKTNPLGIYGKTKLAGENALLEIAPKNSAIIRVSWLYGACANNFVKTMLRLAKERTEIKVVYEQIGSPTYAKDLAEAILTILPKLENEKPSIYHYANTGVASWFDLAKTALKLVNYQGKVMPILTKDYPTPATRPAYSVLDTSKIREDFNLTIPYWQDSLYNCIERLK